MAEEKKDEVQDFKEGPASQAMVSLSQALLAPLDAIFKAQVHAARSFLNLLLQLGYSHRPVNREGRAIPPRRDADARGDEAEPAPDGTPYQLEFYHDITLGDRKQRQKISIPALALIPVAPLAVESADFKFEMEVRQIRKHRQVQKSGREKVRECDEGYDESYRPWFLVDQPISVEGHLTAPVTGETEGAHAATIQIAVKVSRIKTSAGLDKLLTTLTETAKLEEVDHDNNPPPPAPGTAAGGG